jgi:hypothetical protein
VSRHDRLGSGAAGRSVAALTKSALRRGWRLRHRGGAAWGCASSRRRRGRPLAARR